MKAARQSRDEVVAYTTKDGSEIRELMHPAVHGNASQSLAEARVAPGARTRPHRHRETEELYHFLDGEGLMEIGEEVLVVRAGDTVCIPPGTRHCITATGERTLRFLCCCAPAYRDDDTELLPD